MKCPLTEQIQSVIIATKDYKQHLNSYHNFVLGNKQFDWYTETKKFYNNLPLPTEMKPNIACFEAVLSYPIERTYGIEMDELPKQFTFGY